MISVFLVNSLNCLHTHKEKLPIHTVILKQAIQQPLYMQKSLAPIHNHNSDFIQMHSLVTESQFDFLQNSRKEGVLYAISSQGIIPLTNLRDSQYVGPIGVGTNSDGTDQTHVNVVFDTGSTNMWVSSTLCEKQICRDRNKFDPLQSVTFLEKPDSDLDIPFGTGELVGKQGIDAFSVGPYKVVNQTFALIANEIGPIFSQIPFEGILGLGFPSLAVDGHLPFFDSIMAQNVLSGHNEFSFYFTKLPMQASAVFFGGVDDRFYEDKIRLFPVIQEHYWTIELLDFMIGNQTYAEIPKESYHHAGAKITKLIVDTGTTYFTAPPGLAEVILEKIPGTECQEISKYPDITYVLKDQYGEKFNLVISPKVYMVGTGTGYCEPAFMAIPVPDEFGPAFLLGEVFMREFHTTFDRGDGSPGSAYVGFAKAKHDTEAISELLKGRTASGSIAGI
jgi:pepsin A